MTSNLDLLQNCKHNSVMLLNLINDLLDIAKVEKQTFSLNKQFFNMEESLKSVFDNLKFISTNKKVQTQIKFNQDDAKYF